MEKSPAQDAGSVSRFECIASVTGGRRAKIAFYRHVAPVTLNAVLRSLPLSSRVSLQPGMVCLFADLKVGVEKPRTSFARGDAAFLPSAGLICIFLSDARSDRPLNPLGKVEEGMTTFDGLRQGEVVSLSVGPSSTP